MNEQPKQRGERWSGRANWLGRWPRAKVIADACAPELGPLMVRYFLIRTPWFNLYLHRFLRSDNDRHFHDHPWDFVTVLLSGGYWENTPGGRFWRRRFSILRRPAEWQHWVEIVEPVWTLIAVSRKRREWGFHTERGWLDWKTYGSEMCE
jgi:hypothetical protein